MNCSRRLSARSGQGFIAVKCAIKKIESVDDEEIRRNGGHTRIVQCVYEFVY